MFTLAEIDEDPSLIVDLKQDVREECELLGKVNSVVLWDVRCMLTCWSPRVSSRSSLRIPWSHVHACAKWTAGFLLVAVSLRS